VEPTHPDTEILAFQVAENDLGPFVVDASAGEVDELSPVAADVRSYVRGSQAPSDDLKEVLAEPRAQVMAAVIACPSLKLWGRSGGGVLPAASYAICARPALDPELWVAVSQSYEGSYLFEALEGAADAAAWFVETFGAPVDETTTPNHLPPPLAFESFLMALHTIDAFRRTTLQGMLDYEVTEEPAIAVEEFSATLPRSVSSRDLRWLLPAFLHLVPGLDVSRMDLRPEHLEFLADGAFFSPAAESDGSGEVLVFEEVGIALGTEFFHGWLSAAGFELLVRTTDGVKAVEHGFLAPTPMANHLALTGAGPATQINHQAMTTERLLAAMAVLFADAIGQAVEPVEKPAAVTVPAVVGVRGPRADERFELGASMTFGRADDNDVVLADKTASGNHAVLTFTAGRLHVEDLGSTNGTWCNGDRVERTQDLADGDELVFGESAFRIELPVAAAVDDLSGRTVAISAADMPPPPPLPPTGCPSCGSEISPGAKFCRSCGKAMA